MSNPNINYTGDPTVFDDLDDIQCEDVYGSDLPDFDVEDGPVGEFTFHPAPDDFEWFDPDGGITGDAQQYLGDIDAEGGFI